MDETPTSTVPAETAMPTDTTPTRTATPTDRDEATEGSGPGFGVGVAVLSLLAFAVRSARRSRQE
jgi:PGF-CTERM protein